MSNHSYSYDQPPSSPPEVPLDRVLGNGEDWESSYYGGISMDPTFSQHSWDSTLNSSPHSFDSSFLSSHRFSQVGPCVSPVIQPKVSFETPPSMGGWMDEPPFSGPLMLTEQDLSFDPRTPMYNPGVETGYSQGNTIIASSLGPIGGVEAPLEASPEAASGVKPRYRCQVPGCASTTQFTRKTDLQRHHKSLHEMIRFDCEYPWCGRIGENGFVRRDHYLEHLREMHRKDIPKNPRRRSKP